MSVALESARLFDETNRLLKETEQRTAELAVINSVQEGWPKNWICREFMTWLVTGYKISLMPGSNHCDPLIMRKSQSILIM